MASLAVGDELPIRKFFITAHGEGGDEYINIPKKASKLYPIKETKNIIKLIDMPDNFSKIFRITAPTQVLLTDFEIDKKIRGLFYNSCSQSIAKDILTSSSRNMSGLLYPQERGQLDDYEDTLESVEKGITSKIITRGPGELFHNAQLYQKGDFIFNEYFTLETYKNSRSLNTDFGIFYGLNSNTIEKDLKLSNKIFFKTNASSDLFNHVKLYDVVKKICDSNKDYNCEIYFFTCSPQTDRTKDREYTERINNLRRLRSSLTPEANYNYMIELITRFDVFLQGKLNYYNYIMSYDGRCNEEYKKRVYRTLGTFRDRIGIIDKVERQEIYITFEMALRHLYNWMNKVDDENKLRILNEMKKFIHIFITYPSKEIYGDNPRFIKYGLNISIDGKEDGIKDELFRKINNGKHLIRVDGYDTVLDMDDELKVILKRGYEEFLLHDETEIKAMMDYLKKSINNKFKITKKTITKRTKTKKRTPTKTKNKTRNKRKKG